jgi:DNA-binding transcriptional ArsR family regulator
MIQCLVNINSLLKMNVNAMTERSVTVEKSLKALSDDKALILFETIAHQDLDPHNILTRLGLSKRQYYSRMFSMLDAGIIKRKNGTYSVTSFGKVVYKAQTLIGQGISYHWKLKAIDSLEMNSSPLVPEEHFKIMDLLIDNQEIREILSQLSKDKLTTAAVPTSKIGMRVLQQQQ